MAISERLKGYWKKLEATEQVKMIKDQAKIVDQNHKKLNKANESYLNFKGCRTAIRGGRQTTLDANVQRATTMYLSSVDDLKYFVSTL